MRVDGDSCFSLAILRYRDKVEQNDKHVFFWYITYLEPTVSKICLNKCDGIKTSTFIIIISTMIYHQKNQIMIDSIIATNRAFFLNNAGEACVNNETDPLVNVDIAMENHHLQWDNSLYS